MTTQPRLVSHPQLIPYVTRPPTAEEKFITYINSRSQPMRELINNLETNNPPDKADLKMVLGEYYSAMRGAPYEVASQYAIIESQIRAMVGVMVSKNDIDINIFYGGEPLKKIMESGYITFSSGLFID